MHAKTCCQLGALTAIVSFDSQYHLGIVYYYGFVKNHSSRSTAHLHIIVLVKSTGRDVGITLKVLVCKIIYLNELIHVKRVLT